MLLPLNLFVNLSGIPKFKGPCPQAGDAFVRKSTMKFGIYMDKLNSLKDHFIQVIPLTLEAHFIFCKVPDESSNSAGDFASLSSAAN